MNTEDLEQCREIRRLLKEAYDHYFATSDGYCKGSEGYVGVHYPDYFDERGGADAMRPNGVDVYSYVLGPSRMHSFKSMAEALSAVREWHADSMATDYSD